MLLHENRITTKYLVLQHIPCCRDQIIDNKLTKTVPDYMDTIFSKSLYLFDILGSGLHVLHPDLGEQETSKKLEWVHLPKQSMFM